MVRPALAGGFSLEALSPRRRLLLGSFLLLAACLALYGPSLTGAFLWDDDSVLFANPLVKAPDGLWRIWFSTEPLDYFPLVYSSLWLEWRLWGLDPAGYRLVNLLLHAASAAVAWRVLVRLSIPGAWAAALVFAIHPVNVETVAWITQRKNTLPMVFYLLSILSYLRYGLDQRPLWHRLSLALFLLALLGKTMVVPLPFVLLLCDWWRAGRLTRRNLLDVLPFFCVALALGLVTVWFQYNRAISDEIVRSDGFPARLAGAGWAVWFYLSKAVLPVGLSFVYPRWQIDAGSPLSWVPILCLAGVFGLLWRHRRDWGRPCLFALGYFTVTLLPVIGFLDIYFMRYSLVTDHWQYPSILAVAALGCGGAAHFLRRLSPVPRRALLSLGGSLILCLGAAAAHRAAVFRDNTALWRDTLSKNPAAWMAHNNLGAEFFLRSDYPAAAQHYREALRHKPDFQDAWMNLAVAMKKLGRKEESNAALSRVLRIRSNDPAVHMLLGNYLVEQERPREAEEAYRQATLLDPTNPDTHINLGVSLLMQDRLDEALQAYRDAIRVRPEDAGARTGLGNVLLDHGRLHEAEFEYREALRLEPALVDARLGLAVVLSRTGRREEALAEHGVLTGLDPAAAAELLKFLGR